MPNNAIRVLLLAEMQQFSAALNKAVSETESFGTRMTAAGARLSSIGRTLTTHLTLPLAAAGYESVKTAISFQNSMELLHTQAHVGQAAVDSLSKSVLALAGPTATAPEVLSTGIYHLASQGLRGAKAMDALKVAAEGAKMGQANLEDVTNALGATIVSHISGVQNYGQAMGMLNTIVGAGDMRMQDLADAMGTGLAAAAKTAHVSLDQIGGALATFGDNNIRGAKAGTLLISTMRVLGHQSTAAQAALADLGISSDTLQKKLASGGLTSAISYLNEKIKESGKAGYQVSSDLSEAFGGKQSTGIKILIAELDRLKGKVADVGAGGKKFASDWESYTKTTAYHLASMGASMQAAGINIGDVLLPVVAKIADAIGSLMQKFEDLSPGTRKLIVIIAGVAAAIGPVVTVIGSLVTAIGFLVTPIGAVVAGLALLTGAIGLAVLAPDKLKSALEHLGLSAHAAGEVVNALQGVFNVLKTAVMDVVQVVQANWPTISQIIQQTFNVAKTIITTFVSVVEGLWKEFGSQIKTVVKASFDALVGVIRGALQIIKGIIEIFTGVIHGDWSKVWQGIKDITSGAVHVLEAILRGAISILGAIATAVGKGIYDGILKPIGHLAQDIFNKVKQGIEWFVQHILGWIPSEVAQIGKGIADGIIHGVSGLGSGLLHAVTGGLGGALHGAMGFLHINSPSLVWSQNIGSPIAEGIIHGYLLGSASLPSTISASLRKALEQAKATISSESSSLGQAFSSMLSNINTMLPGSVSASNTAAGKQLNAIQAQQSAQQLQDSLAQAQNALAQAVADAPALIAQAQNQVAQAQQQLADAIASGDSVAITDAQVNLQQVQQGLTQQQNAVAEAQKQVDAAQLAIKEADLQKQAAAEAAAQTKANKKLKMGLDDALKTLEAHLKKVGASHEEAQKAIMKLLEKYNQKYKEAGENTVNFFVKGIKDNIKKVASIAEMLAKEIAKYLPHSPAETGPLSKAPGWSNYLLPGLDDALGQVNSRMKTGLAPVPAMTIGGGSNAPLLAGAGAGGGELHIHFSGPVYTDNAGMERLTDQIYAELLKKQKRTGSLQLT